MAKKKKISKAKPKAKRSLKKRKPVKKAVVKRSSKKGKKAVPKKMPVPVLEPGVSLEKIGEVTHYFPKVKAAAVKILKNSLKLGDEIYARGHTTDFRETVNSIQLDRTPKTEGLKGEEIGLLVKSRVRIGDTIYKIKKI